MLAEIVAGVTLLGAVWGAASLQINARLSNFKGQIEELEKKLDSVSERLKLVERERDSAKADLETCRDKRIEVLEENRSLNKLIERLRTIMRNCVNCKHAC